MIFISKLSNNHPTLENIPKIVVAVLPSDVWVDRLKECNDALVKTGATLMTFWGAVQDISFYGIDGTPREFGEDLDACTVRVFQNNSFQLYLPYEYLPYDTWSNLIHWEDAIPDANKDTIVNWVNNPINILQEAVYD